MKDENPDFVSNEPRVLRRDEYQNADVRNVTDLINFLYGERMGDAVIKRIIKKDN